MVVWKNKVGSHLLRTHVILKEMNNDLIIKDGESKNFNLIRKTFLVLNCRRNPTSGQTIENYWFWKYVHSSIYIIETKIILIRQLIINKIQLY